MVDRIRVFSFSAVGSEQMTQDRINPDNCGMTVYALFTGNGSAKLRANQLPDLPSSGWLDVTSWATGAAQLTPSVAFGFIPGFIPYGLRIEVDSLQAANTARFAVNF